MLTTTEMGTSMQIKSSLIAVSLFMMSTVAMSAQTIQLPVTSFELKTDNALDKIESVLLNPESLLKRYKPAGAKITNKSVDRNQFQFNAEKTVFAITQNVFIHSYFNISRDSNCSSKEETGYVAKMDFSGSDKMITDNVEKYEAQICVKELTEGKVKVQVKARLTRGSDYSFIVGPIISDMIAAQNSAFIEAISNEVKHIK